MALSAQSDKVLFNVLTYATPWLDVVYLQISAPPTGLTAPAIPVQDLLTQPLVGFKVESSPSTL